MISLELRNHVSDAQIWLVDQIMFFSSSDLAQNIDFRFMCSFPEKFCSAIQQIKLMTLSTGEPDNDSDSQFEAFFGTSLTFSVSFLIRDVKLLFLVSTWCQVKLILFIRNSTHSFTQSWTASGKLSFLNNWCMCPDIFRVQGSSRTYKLAERKYSVFLLGYTLISSSQSQRRSDASNFASTSAPRMTLFDPRNILDLGVTLRIKYGFLLENSTRSNTIPIFRTESQCFHPQDLLVPFVYELVEVVCFHLQ